jgi:hypothetical protein
MNDQSIIHDISIVTDKLFKEVLFNAEGRQCAISFDKMKQMTERQILSYLIDYFAEDAPGYEGKMLSIKLVRELRTKITETIEQLK